jgi:phosphomannomutase
MTDPRTELDRAAAAWMADDPDPATRAELRSLLDRGDRDELKERFAGRLEFGTAGVRGTLGAGPTRMNRALVRRVTAGLARHLLAAAPDATTRGVVIGRDARWMSHEFAEDTAMVLAGAGIPVSVFPGLATTPLCAFAVPALGAAAGVMITASHNPPRDNGYKVYWENGAQIIPPHDEAIGREVDAISSLAEVPLLDVSTARARGLYREIGPEIGEAYLDGVLALRRRPEAAGDLAIVYTPLHGVGGPWAREALARAGYRRVTVVPEQAEPDPDFPTVSFPNPEEPGAMDLALALGEATGAELILANDPDADRLAAIVRAPSGDFRQLGGNEIGLLLAYYLLTENPPAGETLVMTTVVSSSLLRRMAGALGAGYAEALTGFKWIANRAIAMKRERGTTFVFGFEEALCYTVGELVRDKDGVGAALLLAELASVRRARGETLLDSLETIYRRFGLGQNLQKSLTLAGTEGTERIRAILAGLRRRPPERIGGDAVTARSDLAAGVRVDTASGRESRLEFPSSDVLIYELEGGGRVLVRPSGTEPKIKFYFEVVETVAAAEPFEAARTRARERLTALAEALMTRILGDAAA